MSDSCAEDIIYRLTKAEVLAGTNQLGISEERVTDDVVMLIKIRVSLGLLNWPEVAKSTLQESIRDPLRLVFYPSSIWCKYGDSHFQEWLSSN